MIICVMIKKILIFAVMFSCVAPSLRSRAGCEGGAVTAACASNQTFLFLNFRSLILNRKHLMLFDPTAVSYLATPPRQSVLTS